MYARRKSFTTVFLGGALATLAAAAPAQETLQAVRVVEASEHLADPDAAFWRQAQPVTVAMLPQNVTPPRHPEAAVKSLAVRAVHNGHSFAFHIEWADPTKDDRFVTDQFGDQVAVQLPLAPGREALPSPMMGHPGARVTILQWRAAFQRDLEEGELQVRDLYPYVHVDVYPDQVLRVTDARPYLGALGLDNPVSHPLRTPVLDQMAEGWGTLTAKPTQHADGKGAWKDGRWRVVIVYPFTAGGEADPRLAPGTETAAAFAAWDGGAREVGARKSWSNWVPVKFQ